MRISQKVEIFQTKIVQDLSAKNHSLTVFFLGMSLQRGTVITVNSNKLTYSCSSK